ncbi:MAG: hypothetical protein BWY11_01112 [Firmicutes bacterium ADurb.Bin182]|nr:MAG: hypothetical protein BWY11_01112 [Firmicutes bacterium ADurb.Bin182]
MKRATIALICLIMLVVAGGCITINLPPEADLTPEVVETTPVPALEHQILPLQTPGLSFAPSPVVTAAPAPETDLYSSYAHMVSLDVARGVADFDYFEILKGEDAVKWLVEHEGYSQADAEAEVENFADSEFIEKNTNPKIRQINLTEIPLKLMFRPDGTQVEGAEPVDADYADMFKLYQLDKSLIVDHFFYYIKVKNGEVVLVEQVYWP